MKENLECMKTFLFFKWNIEYLKNEKDEKNFNPRVRIDLESRQLKESKEAMWLDLDERL